MIKMNYLQATVIVLGSAVASWIFGYNARYQELLKQATADAPPCNEKQELFISRDAVQWHKPIMPTVQITIDGQKVDTTYIYKSPLYLEKYK